MAKHKDRASESLRLNFKLCPEGVLSVFFVESKDEIYAIYRHGSFVVCGATTATFNECNHGALHDKK